MKMDEKLVAELTELLVKLAKAADSLPPNSKIVTAANHLARYVVRSFPKVTKQRIVDVLTEEVNRALEEHTPTWVVCLRVSTRLAEAVSVPAVPFTCQMMCKDTKGRERPCKLKPGHGGNHVPEDSP